MLRALKARARKKRPDHKASLSEQVAIAVERLYEQEVGKNKSTR